MICQNCGGTYANDATKCPYCGTMHLAGATVAYNQKFEDITDDLAALGDSHVAEYKETIHRQTKHAFRFFVIGALIALVFASAFWTLLHIETLIDNDADTMIDQLAWQSAQYPALDALYEAGDFDAILAFEDALYEDNANDYTLNDWSHYRFLDIYVSYSDFAESLQSDTPVDRENSIDYAQMLHFYLTYDEPASYLDLTETDLALVAGYVAEVAAFYQQAFGLSEADLLALEPTVTSESGWIRLTLCLEYIEDELLA